MEIDLSTILCGDGVENGRVTRPIPRKGMETLLMVRSMRQAIKVTRPIPRKGMETLIT